MSNGLRKHVGVALAAILLIGIGEAAAGGLILTRSTAQQHAAADHVVAFAALRPIVSENGWGRFVVRDDLLDVGTERMIRIMVADLEPNTEYRIEADGVVVGPIHTDHDGSGVLKLTSKDDGHDPVPDDLPLAEDLKIAGVFDASSALVLEGEFEVVRRHVKDPKVFSDRIPLEDVTGGHARGTAAVMRKESGAQGFSTRATGLAPEVIYSIVVDDLEIGIVITDSGGQGGLELMWPSEENPLPPQLRPVDDIERVSWNVSSEAVLVGSFSDDPDEDCIEVRGEVLEPRQDGFLLRTDDGVLEVEVTEKTRFKGFDSIDQLDGGEIVALEGCFEDGVLIAVWIKLLEDEVCYRVRGKIVEFFESGFVIKVKRDHVEVTVDDGTRFVGFDELDDLDEGDEVVVAGCEIDGEFVADWVTLTDDDDCLETHGEVGERTAAGFILETEDGRFEVVVTDETRFKGFDSLDELDGGEWVAVEGCFDGDVMVAAWIKLIEDDDRECLETRGEVGERTAAGFILETEDGRFEVVVTDETRFKGFDSLDELDGGEWVAVEGCFDGDVLVAAWVKLIDDDDSWWVTDGTVVDLFERGFALEADGEIIKVVVHDQTVFEGVDGLSDIAEGFRLMVEGPCNGQVLHAAKVVVPAQGG